MAPVRSIAILVCSLASPVVARLGNASRLGRSLSEYPFTATTTSFRPLNYLSCGGVDAADVVKGTDYIVVAAAQSMMGHFSQQFAGCEWSCKDGSGKAVSECELSQCASNGGHGDGEGAKDGCSCRQDGSCWCGLTSASFGEVAATSIDGTAQLGCFTCAKGRFTRQRPYGKDDFSDNNANEFASEEVKIVVADSCPYGANPTWCPAKPGDKNICGEVNHIDFDHSKLPAGVNNNYFVFQVEPCAEKLRQNFANFDGCRK